MTEFEKFIALLIDFGIRYERGEWQNGMGNTIERARVYSDDGINMLRFNFIDGRFLDVD
jgi:hypothetical protein